jgi:hypothetical protein
LSSFFSFSPREGKITFGFGGRTLSNGTGTEVRGLGGGEQDLLKEAEKNFRAMP